MPETEHPRSRSRALVAADKFKGTLTAEEVTNAIAGGVEGGDADADRCPIADGGEGTAAVLVDAIGGVWVDARATDALGREVGCRFALLGDGGTAVVEVAEASGLWRIGDGEREPVTASSAGTGDLIAAAASAGAERVLLACGGSATTDGGTGALSRFDPAAVSITCLCDTDVPFPAAAAVYGPQKGAAPEDVAELSRRLRELARSLPHDPSRLPFTGAAGGLAGGLWAHGARLVSGASHVLGVVGFDERLRSADLVITGEGRLDPTSLRGKGVGEVLRRARRAGRPCFAVVGGVRDVDAGGFAGVIEAGRVDELRAAGAGIASRFDPPR